MRAMGDAQTVIDAGASLPSVVARCRARQATPPLAPARGEQNPQGLRYNTQPPRRYPSVPKQPRPHPLNGDFAWQDCADPAAPPDRRTSATHSTPWASSRSRGRSPPAEIAAVTAAIDPLEATEEQRLRDGRRDDLDLDGGRHHLHHPPGEALAGAARLRGPPVHPDVCHDLVGDDVRLYWDQSVYKKTGKVQEFPWHQDNGYTFIEPQQYLTFWLPLVDVDEENGCPWIAPGLHLGGTLDHWLTPIGLQVPGGRRRTPSPVPAKAGRRDHLLLARPHRTGPNLKTGSVRKAYILQYCRGRLGRDAAGRNPGGAGRPRAAVQDPRGRALASPMNYRHAFHAGNHADVFKHAALTLVLEWLLAKPAPFAVLDTHAGVGPTTC